MPASAHDDLVLSIRAALPVDDLARAIRFYQDALGFTSSVLSEELQMAWVGCGDQAMLLFAATGDGPPARTSTAVTIAVSDVDMMVDRLRAVGVVFEPSSDAPIVDLDGSRSAWFRDSEGNFVEVSQRP
jgi:predicted enzyme related to lactoylglutathione lyase